VKKRAQPGVLLPLVAQLKACPSRDDRLTEKRLVATWGSLKTVTLEHGDAITPAVMVGVMLHDTETFAPLLNAAEQAQLQALGQKALERFLQLTNPPHKLGKTIAASLKESP
jgi:hypothetical protein